MNPFAWVALVLCLGVANAHARPAPAAAITRGRACAGMPETLRSSGGVRRRTGNGVAPDDGAETTENSISVLSPHMIQESYSISHELVRADLRRSQAGVPLILDVGVIDLDTCEPLPGAFIELWSADAPDAYPGHAEDEHRHVPPPGPMSWLARLLGFGRGFPPPPFDGRPPPPPFGHPPPHHHDGEDRLPPPPEDPHRGGPGHGRHGKGEPMPPPPPRTGDRWKRPRPPLPPPGRGGPCGGHEIPLPLHPPMGHASSLRGGMATNEDGLVELTTFFPGRSAGRTIHIHAAVHLNWEEAEDGRLVSNAGSVVHVGQIVFPDELTNAVLVGEACQCSQRRRASPNFLTRGLVSEGIRAYVTIGVDASKGPSVHIADDGQEATEPALATTGSPEEEQTTGEGFLVQDDGNLPG